MADGKYELQFKRGQNNPVGEALDLLKEILIEGMKHGFFDFSISCEIANGGKRKLVIRAGKSYQFTILEEEIPQ